MIISNMDLPIETFHKMVGEILMYCQCVEENIRRIYAQRMPGDSRLNYLSIEEERLTMGQMVTKLKELDGELPHPLFEKEDYDMLFTVVRKRNYYAHAVYLSFAYISDNDEEFEQCYARASRELEKDHSTLYDLYEVVEEVRYAYVQ